VREGEEQDGERDSLGKDAERRGRVAEPEREASWKESLLGVVFREIFLFLPNLKDIQRLLELL